MRAGEVLPALASLPIGALDDITLGGGLVVVAPHPDDESLGCGGLIAAACAAGVQVRLVVVSDGVGSHPIPVVQRLRGPESRHPFVCCKFAVAAACQRGAHTMNALSLA